MVVLKSWARGNYPELNGRLPEFLEKAPRLQPSLELWWNAFWDICGDRSGMGDGRILWTSAHLWARSHDLSQEQEFELHCHLKAMDTIYLQHQKEAQNRGK